MRSGVPAAVLCLVLLAGCADPGGPDAADAGPTSTATTSPAPVLPAVAGIAGEVVRLRTDEAIGGQVQVRLTDTGDEPFTVTAVTLTSPAFAVQPPSVQTAAYASGRTIDLPVPFGAVDCSAPVQPVGADIQVDRPDGSTEQLTVPLDGDVLQLVFDEECAAQRIAAYVTVRVDGFTEDGDQVRGDVVLTRVPGSDDVDIAVEGLNRSVLLEPLAADLPATLRAGDPELVLPITVGLASCDPHVLAETKKPFVFPLLLAAAGDSASPDLPLSDGQRAELQALVDRVCS